MPFGRRTHGRELDFTRKAAFHCEYHELMRLARDGQVRLQKPYAVRDKHGHARQKARPRETRWRRGAEEGQGEEDWGGRTSKLPMRSPREETPRGWDR